MIVSNEGLPNDIRVLKEAVALSKKFYVQLIAWDRKGTLKRHEFFNQNIEVFRINLKCSNGNIRDFLIHLPLFWLSSFMFVLKLRVNILHCHDFDTLPIGILAKIVKPNRKLVFDSHEHYPSMISLQTPRVLQRIISILFVSLPRLTNGVIVVNEYLAEFFGKCNTVVIMNVPPLTTKLAKTDLSKHNFENKGFTILYFGNLTKERGIYLLMDLAEKLPNVKLVIAGDGPERDAVLKRCKLCSNISYLGWVSYEEILTLMKTADLIPILYSSDILNNKIATPNKLFLAMSFGKPVVVFSGTLTEQIVKKERIGFAIRENNLEELVGVVKTLTSDPSQFDMICENGQAAFYREYNWEIMENRLSSFYESILGKA
jgi:glycosyltransferase involved in cell wall biosynthesis